MYIHSCIFPFLAKRKKPYILKDRGHLSHSFNLFYIQWPQNPNCFFGCHLMSNAKAYACCCDRCQLWALHTGLAVSTEMRSQLQERDSSGSEQWCSLWSSLSSKNCSLYHAYMILSIKYLHILIFLLVNSFLKERERINVIHSFRCFFFCCTISLTVSPWPSCITS